MANGEEIISGRAMTEAMAALQARRASTGSMSGKHKPKNIWTEPMLEELLRADRLSQVIDHTTAPSFLLGAVAGFLAIMLARVENLTRWIDGGKLHTVHGLA